MSVNDMSLFMPLMVNSISRIRMNVATFIFFASFDLAFLMVLSYQGELERKLLNANKNFLAIKVLYVFYLVQDT